MRSIPKEALHSSLDARSHVDDVESIEALVMRVLEGEISADAWDTNSEIEADKTKIEKLIISTHQKCMLQKV